MTERENMKQLQEVCKKIAESYTHRRLSAISTNDLENAILKLRVAISYRRKNQIESMVEYIQEMTAQAFGISSRHMCTRSRNREHTEPRQVSMYICTRLKSMENAPYLTLNHIGQLHGGRDHSTVVYACKKVEELIYIDKKMRYIVNKLLKEASDYSR